MTISDTNAPQATEEPNALTSRRSLLAAGALAASGAALLATPGAASGAHIVPANEEFDGFRNVVEDGADPTGTMNSSTAIQLAVTGAQATPGATVYFPPGTYRCDTQITLPGNTVLLGHGPRSVLKTGPSSTGSLLVNATGAANIVIDNLAIDATDGSGAGAVPVRMLSTTVGSFVDDVTVRRLYVKATRTGCFAGILLRNVRRAMVHDCVVVNCGGQGIVMQDACQDILVQGNLLKDCDGDHLGLYTVGGRSPARVAVTGNSFDAFDTGGTASATAIAIRGGTAIGVTGNTIRGGRNSAVELDASPGATDVQDIDIAGNVFIEPGNVASPHPSGGSGVTLYATGDGKAIRRVSIRGNSIRAPRQHGVRIVLFSNVNVSVSEVSISDNVISLATGLDGTSAIWSVDPYGTVSDIRVAGNEIRGSRGPGINIKGRVLGGSENVRRLDICDNQVTDSVSGAGPQPAIQVNTVSDLSVTGNRAAGSHGHGLKLTAAKGDVVIARNSFADATQTVETASISGVRRLRIRDNPGFNPWTGDATLKAGQWSGGAQEVRVPETGSLGTPFPVDGLGQPKVKVFATVDGNLQAFAVVTEVQADFFKLKAFVQGTPPGSDQKIGWIAEPRD